MAMVYSFANQAAGLGVFASPRPVLALKFNTGSPPQSFSRFELLAFRVRGNHHCGSVRASAAAAGAYRTPPSDKKEEVFFDGGPHYGDLVANLVFGFTLFWLPLTVAAVFRALFLRYRFTNYRVTILSGLTGGDRKDFKYDAIKDVKYVPRFIGEWGDLVITLKDGTQVELKSLPKFREIATFCLEKSGNVATEEIVDEKKKGFS